MQRNISKLIEDYDRRSRASKNSTKGAFYASDIEQIREITIKRCGYPDSVMLIGHALEAGYMIGYRTGQRDARRRQIDRDQEGIS